jgi:hypothetical protein
VGNVLECAAERKMHLPPERIEAAEVAFKIRIDEKGVVCYLETPWLGVVRIGRENSRMDET